MTLRGLISIADRQLTMSLTKMVDKKPYRYNFSKWKWDDSTVIDVNKVITIKDFINKPIYSECMKDNLITWSNIDYDNLKYLSMDNHPKRDMIVCITIESKNSKERSKPAIKY